MSIENYGILTNHGLLNYVIQNSLITSFKKKDIQAYEYLNLNLIYDDFLFQMNEYLKIKVINEKSNLLDEIELKKQRYRKRIYEFIETVYQPIIHDKENNQKIKLSDDEFEKEIELYYS
jgi:hypothetical protein